MASAASHMAARTPRSGASGRREGRSCIVEEISGRAPEKFDAYTGHPSRPVWRPSIVADPRGAQAVPTSWPQGAAIAARPDLVAVAPSLGRAGAMLAFLVAVEMAEAGQRREERDQSGQRQESLYLHSRHLLSRSGSPGAPRPRGETAWPLAGRRPSAPADRPARSRLRRDGWWRTAGRSSPRTR